MGKYRGRYFVRKRVWRCGGYIEIELYPVFQRPGVRRSRCRPSRECQQRLNQRNAESKIRRLILDNFTERDLEIDLTYGKPDTPEEAEKDIARFIRKLRKLWKDSGSELKYIIRQEQGKKSGRIHFHMILNAGPFTRDELESLWPHGYANSRRLRLDETGLAGLASYISKEGKQRRPEELGKRRWNCSRNLHRPSPEVSDAKVRETEARELADAIARRGAEGEIEKLYPGMTLVEAEALKNQINRGLYVYLSLAPPEAWHGRRPVPRYFSGELGEAEP